MLAVTPTSSSRETGLAALPVITASARATNVTGVTQTKLATAKTCID